MKKLKKYIIYTFALILLLVILAITFIQLPIGKSYILNFALGVAKEKLNAELKVSELNGNLFSEIVLNDIEIIVENETLLSTKQITLDYDLFAFVQDSIIIHKLLIDTTAVNLYEKENGIWNYTQIVIADSSLEVNTEKSKFPYIIKLEEFQITNLEANYLPIDSSKFIPKKIENFKTSLNALYKDSHLEYELEKLSFNTINPFFEIDSLYSLGSFIDNNLLIAIFNLSTAKNGFHINGNYNLADNDSSKLTFITENLQLTEFSEFIELPKIKINPTINLDAVLFNQNLALVLSVSDQKQKIVINGSLNNFKEIPNYNAVLTLEDIDIASILNNDKLPTNLTGKFSITGEGFDVKNNSISLLGNISNIKTYDQQIDSLSLIVEKSQDSVNITTNIERADEKAKLSGFIKNLFETQNYILNIKTEKIDISKHLNNEMLVSNINTNIDIIGNSFDFDNLSAEVSISTLPSSINGFNIDTLYGNVQIKEKEFIIDSLILNSKNLRTNVSGLFSLDHQSNIQVDGSISDLTTLSSITKLDSLYGNSKFSANLTGTIDNLRADYNLSLSDLSYQNIAVKNSFIKGSAFLVDTSVSSSNEITINNISVGDFVIDKTIVISELDDNHIKNSISITINDSALISLNPTVVLDTSIKITTNDFEVMLPANTWHNQDPFFVDINDKIITIDNLNLYSGEKAVSFSAIINDTLFENTRLKLQNIDISQVYIPTNALDELTGILNLTAEFEGSSSNPIILGDISFRDITYKDYDIGDLTSNVSADLNNVSWQLNLSNGTQYQLENSGNFNYDLNNKYIIDTDSPISFSLISNNIELSKLPLFEMDGFDITGILNSNFKISNTLSNPIIDGNISLTNGTFNDNFYGTDIDSININLVGDSSKFIIDKFSLVEPGGHLDISGYITTAFHGTNSPFDPSKISLKAKEFDLFDSDRYALRLNGSLEFQVADNDATFDGYLTIPRSKYYVPSALSQSSGKNINQSTPILVQEINKDKVVHDTILVHEQIPDSLKLKWAKNISGKFTVDIPSNCWLRGPNINMEIYGKLDIIKDRENLALLGQIKINRGYYTIFGKKFTVNEGRISFDGNPKFNPDLVLEVEYSFRDSDKQKRNLVLRVTNTMLNPEIQFSIDEQPIDQADAISYILFGKRKDELTQSQQSGINSGEVAANLAANLLASQISNTFGNTLSLDVIEITGEDNWTRGSFTAGKYVTDDLFIQYEKGFGKDDDGTVDPQIFTLEYQITRLLYLQLIEATNKTSGFDILIKFD